ncbi:hypothetical protein [Pelagicoccus mobilis]|uniref:Uncharacterized protein n=1 Tax=Pelagicoccus mobilis TaxID=415221 RepID=A0A934RQW2_9BACT|nr:hypothetical protein [Pelagicoccus mobilis]MBK1875252.1 hypothetical protein [Pelagicoccus mobilis]
MPSKHDSDWELVEEIPGEKKPNAKKGGFMSLLKNKTLWIGLIAGAALVIAVPVLRVMLQNALRAWWIWVGLALYFIWARLKKAGATK